MNTQERVILVTGGTGGLGQAVTKAFLDQGDQVIVTYRRETERDALIQLVGSRANQMVPKVADVTQESSVNQLIEQILAEFGQLDALVHLIGGFAGGTQVGETTLETFERMVTLNLKSAFLVTRGVLPVMQSHKKGKIVTVSSRGAVQVGGGASVYAASKAGVIALTQAIAAEYGSVGIHANVILPGMIDTPSNRHAMPDADRSSWVSPEAIADVILFLCSLESSGVNGATIPIYGQA